MGRQQGDAGDDAAAGISLIDFIPIKSSVARA
jgi:hypothetical protein